jgi:hypothetical protein
MASERGAPVFAHIGDAVRHAVQLVRSTAERLTAEGLRAVLADVAYPDAAFRVEEHESGFLVSLSCLGVDVENGRSERMEGRRWHVSPIAGQRLGPRRRRNGGGAGHDSRSAPKWICSRRSRSLRSTL